MKKYWIASVSKEHALRGLENGFIQVCHGKEAPLKRMHKGDGLLIYSGKISMSGNEKCQCFTAVGELKDEVVYQAVMSADFKPFRKHVTFFPANERSIIPLIPHLDFIKNKKSWGYPFRFGILEIEEKDFKFIASKMLIDEEK